MSKKNTTKSEVKATETKQESAVSEQSLNIPGLEGFEWFEPSHRQSFDSPAVTLMDKKIMLNSHITNAMKQHNLKAVKIAYNQKTNTLLIKPYRNDSLKSTAFTISSTNLYKQFGIRVLENKSAQATVHGEGDNIAFTVKLPDDVFIKNQPEQQTAPIEDLKAQTEVVSE